jgi:spore coat polysaccharide biosynthesis protein SpsF
MTVVATIEARMTSKRLPGKVMANCRGISMLERLATRLRSVSNIDEVLIATTTNSEDDIVVELASNLGVRFFRGSEDNVFDRVIQAATFAGADTVVEITGDCPLLDPVLVEQMVEIFRCNSIDYLSNCESPSFPAGMEIQVVSLQALIKSYQMTNSVLDREHVTLHIRKNPQQFRQMHLIAPLSLRFPELSVTLDESADLEVIRAVIENLETSNPLFGCEDIVQFLNQNPDIAKLNKSVARKGDA